MTGSPALASVRLRIEEATRRWASGATLADIRDDFDVLANESDRSGDIFLLDGLRAAWFGGGDEHGTKQAILYFHGGGFQIGSLRSHQGMMTRLAAAADAPVVGFEYRRAPEFRFPAAHDDAFKAYAALCSLFGDDGRIALAGDSAGGNLALATAIAAARGGLPRPACVALISPWLDLATRGASYESRAEKDFFSKPAQLRAMARTYLGRDADPASGACSPLYEDLTGLPPILVHAGDHDITLDDSLTLAQTASTARDVDVQLRVWPGMFHHFQMFPELPETRESFAEIGAFLAGHLGRPHRDR